MFTLIGEPPFTFTYQRAELQRSKHKTPKVLETHTVTGIMTNEYSIFSALEGSSAQHLFFGSVLKSSCRHLDGDVHLRPLVSLSSRASGQLGRKGITVIASPHVIQHHSCPAVRVIYFADHSHHPVRGLCFRALYPFLVWIMATSLHFVVFTIGSPTSCHIEELDACLILRNADADHEKSKHAVQAEAREART